MEIRRAGLADVGTICRQRQLMFLEEGRDPATVSSAAPAFREWLSEKLATGGYVGWLAVDGGVTAAGIGLSIIDWAPHPNHPADNRRGYLLNLYVEPACRRRGLARMLLGTAVEECRRRRILYLFLHPTTAARRMYERSGWSPTGELRLLLTS